MFLDWRARAQWLGGWIERGIALGEDALVAVLRGYWGYQFYITGYGKLGNIERVVSFFETLHIPMPRLNAYMAGGAECFGGLLLAFGLLSRPAALVLSVTMSVAYVTADWDAVVQLTRYNPEPFLKADPFMFLLVALLVLVHGPGLFSLDALAAWLLKGKLGLERLGLCLWTGRSVGERLTPSTKD